jgi:hypothetical protein
MRFEPLIGGAGIGAVEIIQQLPAPTDTVEIVKLAIQVILGIASLFHMFKKPKKE